MELDQALSLIRSIPDYPKAGIIFKDITPMLADGDAFATITKSFDAALPASQTIAGIEARGFIFACALAAHRNSGFVPIRKAGKLPHATHEVTYGLEYGVDTLQIHQDALIGAQSVVIIDDVLATGGTALAAIELVKKSGGVVCSIAFLMEIPELGGRANIAAQYPEIPVVILSDK